MPPNTTRDQILDCSLNLFYQHGFEAVGIDRIVKEVGVVKATFYNHFASKDSLILAVVEKRDAWWRKTLRDEITERGGDDPVARLRAIFDVLNTWFGTHDFNGCLFINCASAFPSPLDPAHKAAKANVDAIRGMIAELADEAKIANPYEFAQQFNLIVEGAIVTEVIDRKGKAAETGARLANTLIDFHLGQAEP
ncbi:MAG: TetR/AcrR family transcriptional regulator [Phycisphaeraceae bacterium]|nr:MAG: TetR/AcrR family transcriptional regulator [Phycisphaeraceae bacterium]